MIAGNDVTRSKSPYMISKTGSDEMNRIWLAYAIVAGALLLSSPGNAQNTSVGLTPCGSGLSISASTVTSNTQLSTCGPTTVVWNTGTVDVFINWGTASNTAATTSGWPIPAGSSMTLNSGRAGLYLAAITGSSSSTVRITQGNGSPALAGGGAGGGGGGGGAVTLASGAVASGAYSSGSIASGAYASGAFAVGSGADGWDVTQGAKADAVCGSDTGTCSIVALLKRGNQNTSGSIAAGTNIIGVVTPGGSYETIAASQTGQTMGATGATGDYLSHCVVYPTSTSPGVVTVFDNTSTTTNNVITFPGGSSSISNLVPFSIPVGAISLNGPWKVTTGANLLVICYGKFT